MLIDIWESVIFVYFLVFEFLNWVRRLTIYLEERWLNFHQEWLFFIFWTFGGISWKICKKSENVCTNFAIYIHWYKMLISLGQIGIKNTTVFIKKSTNKMFKILGGKKIVLKLQPTHVFVNISRHFCFIFRNNPSVKEFSFGLEKSVLWSFSSFSAVFHVLREKKVKPSIFQRRASLNVIYCLFLSFPEPTGLSQEKNLPAAS